MPLKRGLERESCDFCFRRKIKCDRSSRAAAGHPTCSQCDLRQALCTFESDDVRLQRRQKTSPNSTMPDISLDSSAAIKTKALQQISNDGWTHANNSGLIFDHGTLPAPFPGATAVSTRFPDARIATVIHSPTAPSPLSTYRDFDFDLSQEGILFLDSVFLQSHDTTGLITTTTQCTTDSQLIGEPPNDLVLAENPYFIVGLLPETLDAAIDAYFNFASLTLPVLSRNGFVADYQCQLSSPALVFAVACRGCPFIQATDKWILQQRLASHFRERFLQAQSTTSTQHVVRLDDLEALSLMIDFEYQEPADLVQPLQSQLQSLLLTHDSLVAMMLQYRIETHVVAATGIATTLSGATQRQTLLFWFVYGWDAFRCLDLKLASRIMDQDIDLSSQLDSHEGQSYFDTILSLATIARKMTQILCSPLSRRKGVKHWDIENLYRRLEDWHVNICPATLQIPPPGHTPSHEGRLPPGVGMGESIPLRAVVITLLELNCFMQLEACVSQHGIEEHDSLMGKIADTRVKYETLQAAYKIVNVARSIEELTVGQRTPESSTVYAMADVSPGIIRNICAGASTWLSQKAIEIFRLPAPGGVNDKVGDGYTAGQAKKQTESWLESITVARDIAAAAISHEDTERLVRRLDRQIVSLSELINAHKG